MAGEKIFENKVKRYLESLGIYALGTSRSKMSVEPIGYYEKRWGSMFSSNGLPDMHICVHGHSIEVELKGERGRVSELQKFMIEQINDAGGTALVLRPDKFGDFKLLLEKYL